MQFHISRFSDNFCYTDPAHSFYPRFAVTLHGSLYQGSFHRYYILAQSQLQSHSLVLLSLFAVLGNLLAKQG